jgi:hypothetical protein
MNGYSEATVRLRGSLEEITFRFQDENTSIAASAPGVYEPAMESVGVFVPVPSPLKSVGFYPLHTPDRYRNVTSSHLLQVISMNMRSRDSEARLLIGLPFAEAYPELFFSSGLLDDDGRGAASYGVVQSLTAFVDSRTGVATASLNGYPARSFFGIFHLIETPIGALFNKKATQMELQPDSSGKLALKLPPIPFLYQLVNGPIPLFDAREPDGEPIADLIRAKHGSDYASGQQSEFDWPWHVTTVPQSPATRRGRAVTARRRGGGVSAT